MTSQTLAFFGATGDCAGYALANTLKAGYNCVALARTPAKLTKSMKDKGVSTDALDAHLTIVQGDVKNVANVKEALQLNGRVVDTIVSGIGAVPKLQWSLYGPVTIDDTKICQRAGQTILAALKELNPARKALLINISTTGIAPAGSPRDVPLLFVPLYHWILKVPHQDKAILNAAIAEELKLPESQRGIQGVVHVKPSLLMNGESCGIETVRAGVDEAPAVGYTIRRVDVGLFIFEKLIKDGVKSEWMNKGVSITY